MAWSSADAVLVSADIRTPLARLKPEAHFGGEWRITAPLAVRLGLDNWRVTGGVGLRMLLGTGGAEAVADYAFVTAERYEDHNRLTLMVRF